MGPRLFSRGNEDFQLCEEPEAAELQWGHDFSAVEILVLTFLLWA